MKAEGYVTEAEKFGNSSVADYFHSEQVKKHNVQVCVIFYFIHNNYTTIYVRLNLF